MRKYSFLFGLGLALIMVSVSWAHPADMYRYTHSISVSPNGIQITWEIAPGPMLAPATWQYADQDQDGTVSDQEARAWAQTVVQSLSLSLDGTRLALDLQTVEWPSGLTELVSGEEPISIHLRADWSISIDQAHQLVLQNQFNPKDSVSWFDVHGTQGILFDVPEQDGGTLRLRFGRSTAEEGAEQLTTWESGRPSVPWAMESLGSSDGAERSQTQSGIRSILGDLVKDQRTSPAFVLAAMVVAVLLGALHALSPGHGKTIVAAYLVGSQGKFYHAFALGAIVTLTHTGSVFALGLLTLTASRHLMAVDIFPILEIASGVLIFVLGIGLLYPRLRRWITYRRRQRQMRNRRPVAVRDPSGEGRRLLINQSVEESGPPHSHDPGTLGYVPRGPAPGNPLSSITWRSLVTLGISGGLVPCPDAIAILLIAATLNRIAFGLSLIVAFSIGLAIVLIAIGLLIVQGKRLFARLQWFDRIAYVMPVFSALVVLGLGAVMVIGALGSVSDIRAGILEPRPVAEGPTFDLQEARVLYTALDPQNRYQLFIVPAIPSGSDAQPVQMTDHENGVWHYAVSPDRDTVIYATDQGENGSQLWQLVPATGERTLILDSPDAVCSQVVWFPDGSKILYNRSILDLEENPSGFPSLWWLDLATQEAAPLFQDAQIPGFNARWSPDGQWLSYTPLNPQEIRIYNLVTGASQSLPTQMGSPAVWSPSGETLLLVDIEVVDDLGSRRLLHYDIANQTLSPLETGEGFYEDYPAWSPGGAWIAVVRRAWRTDNPASGDEIWLMRPDGRDAHPVAQEQAVFHGQPVWSPDGQYLLYSVSSASASDSPGMYILDVETGDSYEIAIPGKSPTWLP